MTQVHYEEDGDEVIFEVEDNTLDFETEMDASQIIERYERSDPKDDDEDSEEEQDDNSQGSRNNNALRSEEKGINYDGPGTSQGQGTQKIDHSEEEGMQRFVDYIRKQGLVIVDASKAQNETPKFDKRREMGGMNTQRNKKLTIRREEMQNVLGCNNESMVTIYKNAVQKVNQVQVSGHQIGDGKRDSSSSSDKQLDTSDELDRVNRMVITNNDVNEFITEVAANAERPRQQ